MFFFLTSFLLSSFNSVLSVWEAIRGVGGRGVLEGLALCQPWKQMWLVPCCWGMRPFRVAVEDPIFQLVGS